MGGKRSRVPQQLTDNFIAARGISVFDVIAEEVFDEGIDLVPGGRVEAHTHDRIEVGAGEDGEGTVYMTMGGGCHGCSMSKMTMLDGVQTMLSEQIPAVERVKDLTDHSTGENPYYS